MKSEVSASCLDGAAGATKPLEQLGSDYLVGFCLEMTLGCAKQTHTRLHYIVVFLLSTGRRCCDALSVDCVFDNFLLTSFFSIDRFLLPRPLLLRWQWFMLF